MTQEELLDIIWRGDDKLSASQLRILAYLVHKEQYLLQKWGIRYIIGLPRSVDVANDLGWPRQTVSSAVRKLVSLGYVKFIRITEPRNEKEKRLRTATSKEMLEKKLCLELEWHKNQATQYQDRLENLLNEYGYLPEGTDPLSVDREKLTFNEWRDWDIFDNCAGALETHREQIAKLEQWLSKTPIPKKARFAPGMDFAPFEWFKGHEEALRKQGIEVEPGGGTELGAPDPETVKLIKKMLKPVED